MMIDFQESRYPLQSKDPLGEFQHQKKKKKNQRERVMMANNRENVFPYTWRATWIWIIEEQL